MVSRSLSPQVSKSSQGNFPTLRRLTACVLRRSTLCVSAEAILCVVLYGGTHSGHPSSAGFLSSQSKTLSCILSAFRRSRRYFQQGTRKLLCINWLSGRETISSENEPHLRNSNLISTTNTLFRNLTLFRMLPQSAVCTNHFSRR